jgi:hypothetical protein
MKSKNPRVFWLRWLGISSLHGLLFTLLWMSITTFVTQWTFIPLNLISGVILASLQYWAMPPMMRPDAKRWFFASILGQVVSVTLHGIAFYSSWNTLALLSALFLPLAIAQSWALSERFKKAWLFGIATLLPALIYLGGTITIYERYQIIFFEILFWFSRASLSGLALFFLQKYQRKDMGNVSVSTERLLLQDEENSSQSEEVELIQQKTSYN